MTRLRYAMVTTAAVIGVAIAAVVPTSLELVWNASASVPIGLYVIVPTDRLDVTDLVAVMPPEPLAAFMVERGYVGPDVPLLKRVMALPGQRVCRRSRAVTVDGVPLGEALDRDSRGRDLPVWQGCRRVANGEVFLMNPEARDSLDGRYFGPLPASAVIGRATPLYTDEDGDGRFVWRADAVTARPSRSHREKQETTTMAQIGQFIRTERGFEGHLKALGLDAELTLVPAEPSESENAPDYRVLLGDEEGFDIGAGWTHVGDRAGEYVSIELESPLFARPLRANLFRSGGDGTVWGLHTNRPAKQRKED